MRVVYKYMVFRAIGMKSPSYPMPWSHRNFTFLAPGQVDAFDMYITWTCVAS